MRRNLRRPGEVEPRDLPPERERLGYPAAGIHGFRSARLRLRSRHETRFAESAAECNSIAIHGMRFRGNLFHGN
jgi:hypothetical protein